MRVCLVALLCVAACGDDSAPPFLMPDASFDGDAGRPLVGRGDSCEFNDCMADLVCGTTSAAQRCLAECDFGDPEACEEDEECTTLPEGALCTPLAERPPYVLELDYDVANLHGNAVGIELDPVTEVLDVVVDPEEPLQLLNSGAEGTGEARPNIRFEVFAQDDVPDGADDKVNVFAMRSLVVPEGAQLIIGGSRPTILLIGETAVIDGEIIGTEAGGVGGGARGVESAAGGPGLGLGGGLPEAGSGGGGASYCSVGGAGGGTLLDPPAPDPYGNEECEPLLGGSSGAGTGERSGAGGPALQISTTMLMVSGTINMSGYAAVDDGMGPGGGGGSGGALLIQARTATVDGTLRVDGGTGGLGSEEANLGGEGSSFVEPVAQAGTTDGGGGGGSGWLRVEADSFTAMPGAVVSPALDGECASEGDLAPSMGPAPEPPMCMFPEEAFTPARCDLCHRRFCCDALTACEEDANCPACLDDPDAPICTDDPDVRTLFTSFTSCLNQFCFDACP